MDIQQAFGRALQAARKARNLTQEDFGDISSRTYVSTLERGLKSPTLEKIDALAERIDVHPLTLIALAYVIQRKKRDPEAILSQVRSEIEQILG